MYAKIKFLYKDEIIYFIQSKYAKPASLQTDMEVQQNNVVYNRWLSQEINIAKEEQENMEGRYVVSLIFQGAYYSLVGNMEEDKFTEMVGRLSR